MTRDLAGARHRFPDVLGFVLGRMSRWPRRVLDGFGYCAYFVVYRILRWRRALAATNIANAFPEKDATERAVILQQSYRNLGRFLAEALWGWNASAEALAERVRIVNPELLTRYTADGRFGGTARRAFLQLGVAAADGGGRVQGAD